MYTENDVKEMIDDTIEAADKVYRKFGRKGIKDGTMWELDHDKQRLVLDIIAEMMNYGLCDFYGFSGKVSDTDLILSFEMNELGTDSDIIAAALPEYLREVRELKFIPHDGYMTVQFTVKDVYPKS